MASMTGDSSDDDADNNDDAGLSYFAPPPAAALKQEIVELEQDEPGQGSFDGGDDRHHAAAAPSARTWTGPGGGSSSGGGGQVANGQHADNDFASPYSCGVSTSSAMIVSSSTVAAPAATQAEAAATQATADRLGFIGNEEKWARFNEFITGILSVSLFQAADVWLPVVGEGAGAGRDASKPSRLFLFSTNVQARTQLVCHRRS